MNLLTLGWGGPPPQSVKGRREGLPSLEADIQTVRRVLDGDPQAALGLPKRKRKVPPSELLDRLVRHRNRYLSTLTLATPEGSEALWKELASQVPELFRPDGGSYERLVAHDLYYKVNFPRPQLPLEHDRDVLSLSLELDEHSFVFVWDWFDSAPVARGVWGVVDDPVPSELVETASRALGGSQARWCPLVAFDERFSGPLRWTVGMTCGQPARLLCYEPSSGEVVEGPAGSWLS